MRPRTNETNEADANEANKANVANKPAKADEAKADKQIRQQLFTVHDVAAPVDVDQQQHLKRRLGREAGRTLLTVLQFRYDGRAALPFSVRLGFHATNTSHVPVSHI